MSEDSNIPNEAEAAQSRAEALQRFWMTCMENIVKGGASEREASMQMLTVASAYLGRACGPEGAMQLLVDQASFFATLASQKDKAVIEAANAPSH